MTKGNSKESISWDFPGDPVVKNLPCNAQDLGSIPGGGTRIPYAVVSLRVHGNYRACVPQLESLRATTKDPT